MLRDAMRRRDVPHDVTEMFATRLVVPRDVWRAMSRGV